MTNYGPIKDVISKCRLSKHFKHQKVTTDQWHETKLPDKLKRAFNLWWQPCWAPFKETAGKGTPIEKTALIEAIIHHLGDLLQLFISVFHTLTHFGYKNIFVFYDFVIFMTKCKTLLLNNMYFLVIFIAVKIACITILAKKPLRTINFFNAKTIIPFL